MFASLTSLHAPHTWTHASKQTHYIPPLPRIPLRSSQSNIWLIAFAIKQQRRETHRRVVWWVIFKVGVVKSSLTAATLHRVHRVLQEAVGHVCILCNQSFNQSADQSMTSVYISILTHQQTNNQIYSPQSKSWEWLQNENEEIELFKTTLSAQKATGSTTI